MAALCATPVMRIAEWRKGLQDIRVSDERRSQGEERESETEREREDMGYVLRVRLASFFAGAAMASTAGLYVLYQDYKVAHHSISDQMKLLHDSLDKRISALEKLKEAEVPQQQQQQVEATE